MPFYFKYLSIPANNRSIVKCRHKIFIFDFKDPWMMWFLTRANFLHGKAFSRALSKVVSGNAAPIVIGSVSSSVCMCSVPEGKCVCPRKNSFQFKPFRYENLFGKPSYYTSPLDNILSTACSISCQCRSL